MPILCPCRASRHQIWRTLLTVPPTALATASGLGEGIAVADWVPTETGANHWKVHGGTMRIRRQFTEEGRSAYEGIAFRTTSSEIRNPDGSVVFQQEIGR